MNDMYDLSIDQCANIIAKIGHKRTCIVQGHMGTGKTRGIREKLEAMLPKHLFVEFNCTDKDVQDLSVPKFMERVGDMVSDYVSFVPNEELGLHHGRPVILQFDEFLKSVEPVKRASRRIMLERVANSLPLPEGSIVYGTSNLGEEGLGDSLAAHQCNALVMLRMRKPTAMEWIEWGIVNGIDPLVLGWAKETPQVFQTYEEVNNPSDNPYIFHPREQRVSFVTPRSLEAASDILKCRDSIDDHTVTATLIGTIGGPAAMHLMTFARLADDLPTRDDIKLRPDTAKVPSNVAAMCLVVYRTLATIEADWVDAWMTYMERLSPEVQAMFIQGARAKGYRRQAEVFQNARVGVWATENSHLFAADQ